MNALELEIRGSEYLAGWGFRRIISNGCHLFVLIQTLRAVDRRSVHEKPESLFVVNLGDPVIVPADNNIKMPGADHLQERRQKYNEDQSQRKSAGFFLEFLKNDLEGPQNENDAENVILIEFDHPQQKKNDHVEKKTDVVKTDPRFFLADDQGHRDHKEPEQVFDERIENQRDHPTDKYPSEKAAQRNDHVKKSEFPLFAGLVAVKFILAEHADNEQGNTVKAKLEKKRQYPFQRHEKKNDAKADHHMQVFPDPFRAPGIFFEIKNKGQ